MRYEKISKKETKFSGKHTSAKHTQGWHLFGTHTPKFVCETLCSRYTNVVSRSRTAYHSQVFRSPNPLNGEQLTCSKAACEGGGTVLRFNCPQKRESLLNLWHGLYSHSYLGKVSGPPLGIVVCLTSGQNVLTKCIFPDSCCDMYIFSSQLQRESS